MSNLGGSTLLTPGAGRRPRETARNPGEATLKRRPPAKWAARRRRPGYKDRARLGDGLGSRGDGFARQRLLGQRIRPFEREGERRALARAPVGPDAPAVLLDDLLAHRESDARALEAVGAVQALEGAEDQVGLPGGEADAVVADGHARHVLLVARRDLD